ncbi:trigger factor [Chthonobacter rhizosphaerae]|uniref:trigger factor n=1 Tax=Chthonobacter rhizosphaerae TaxID=2735553 RepID=UPI0015EFC474|nr:trigger factor [Chthonobacter rhizosphaerae]
MQVHETAVEGLKRELKIVVPATELASRLDTYLNDLKGRVQIRGFRPGKVPMTHLKKMYGKSAMAEIVNTVIGETTSKAVEERNEKSAVQPKVDLADAEAEKVLDGDADLAFTLSYEVIPSFDVQPVDGVSIERPVVEVTDEEIQERLTQIAEGSRSYEPRESDAAAAEGDRVQISYLGKIDGEPFEGGADDRAYVFLGQKRFIPGFEEQLVGLKVGDTKVIEVTFPEDYPAPNLSGKPATFDIEVFEIAAPGEVKLDDDWAKTLGLDSLDALKAAVKAQVESQYGAQTRQKVKRQLLDQLDKQYSFDLPPTLVGQEFDIIWRQVTGELERTGKSFEDEGTTEEKAREEYTKIAERRVRLGLVLSKIGEENKIQVTEPEIQRALVERARQFPGQERQVFEYYRKDPQALASLQAPVFEEKVVDYLLGQVKVEDKTVTKEELFKDDEDEAAAA